MESSQPTFLVVDDETVLLRMLSTVFTRKGCQVVTASSGEEALGLVRTRSFDLALLDIRMPGMDGVALMKELHNLYPDMPVILMSGYTDFTPETAMDQGAVAWLDKPFHNLESVWRTVSHAFELSRTTPA